MMTNRAEFIKEVIDFKEKHNGKLKDLLNVKTNRKAVNDFLANPVIHSYEVKPPCNIYGIATVIREQRFLNKSGVSPRFLIIPNWKDGHATMCITVVDPLNRRPLISDCRRNCRQQLFQTTQSVCFF